MLSNSYPNEKEAYEANGISRESPRPASGIFKVYPFGGRASRFLWVGFLESRIYFQIVFSDGAWILKSEMITKANNENNKARC